MKIVDNRLFNKWIGVMMVATMLGGFTDIYNVVVVGASSLTLIPSLHLTSSDYGLVAAMPFIGSPFGAILIGPLSDKFGRKATFTYTLLAFTAAMVISAFVTSYYELLAIRFVAGVVIGADLVVSYLLTSELSLKKTRGRNSSLIVFLQTTGAWVALILAYFLITPLGDLQWRALFLIGAIFPAIGFVVRTKMPEPPRWSVADGNMERAKKDLMKIGMSEDSIELFKMDKPAKGVDSKKVFRKYALPIIIPLFVVTFLINIPIAGFAALSPLIFSSLKIPNSKSLLYSFLIVQIPEGLGILFVTFSTDKIGRHVPIIMGSIITGIVLILAGYFFILHNVILFIIFLIIGAFVLDIAITVTYFIAAELFPERNRGTGQGINVVALRSGGIFATYGGALLLSTYGGGGILYFYGIVMLIAFPISLWALGKKIDTKQKDLEYVSNRFLND